MYAKYFFIYAMFILLIMTGNLATAMDKGFDEAERFVYVSEGAGCGIAQIDLETSHIMGRMSLDEDDVSSCLIETVLSPEGDRLYAIEVHKHTSEQFLYVFDTSSRQRLHKISLGWMPLAAIVLKPDGSAVYISSYGSHISDTIWEISTHDLHVEAIARKRRDAPLAMAISLDGSHLYVSSTGSHQISIIDTTNRSVIGTIEKTSSATIRLSSDGKILYLKWTNLLWIVDMENRAVVWEKTLPYYMHDVGSHMAISSDGRKLYTTLKLTGLVEIDLKTWAVTTLYPSSSTLWDIRVSKDDNTIYLIDVYAGELLLIDRNTQAVKTRVRQLGRPQTMTLGRLPDQLVQSQ